MRLISIGSAFGAPDYYRDLVKDIQVLDVYNDSTLTRLKDVIGPKDLVLFGGGEDISPMIYRSKASRWNHGAAIPSTRDIVEMAAFKQAQKVGAFCYGICRGAQMLCALSGGKLVQHVNGHGSGHWITLKDGRELITSSVHHQMMYPFDMKPAQYEVIGWSKKQVSSMYVMDDSDIRREIQQEPEIVYFPETRSLGIQGHPEFMPKNADLVKISRELLTQYFLTDKE